ncbi:MAG TPA: MATE family efflux transporter, partial [Firmicutes bacterium]|nr:MATE family efflux transporter [Bacillota bacterium]
MTINHRHIQPTKPVRGRLDLVNGPVFKTMLLLAGPVVVSHLLNLAIGIADVVMVGKLGTEAQTALVISMSVIMLLNAIALGNGFATITYVSQHTGAGNEHLARRSAAHSLMLAVILGIAIALVASIVLVPLVAFLNSEQNVTDNAINYSRMMLTYAAFFFLLFICISIMQGLGDTVTPLIIMLCMNALNILLNFLLIFGKFGFPEMGIMGAATGSVISRAVGAFIVIVFLASGKYRMTLRFPDFKPIIIEFWNILRLGIPNSLQSLLRNANVILLYRILSHTNEPVVAQNSLGVGFQSEALAFVPLLALMIATGAMVGQNLGAGKPDRAEEATWTSIKTAFWLMLIACFAFLVFPDKIIAFFSEDPAVIASAALYLRINAITQIFQSGFVIIGCLRGAGDSMNPLYAHISCQWLLRLPLSYLLAITFQMNATGVWVAMAITSIIENLIYYYL